MDVTISVPGEFHAPKLAHGLEKRGLLRKYYSTHPKKNIPKQIPKNKITSLWPIEIVSQISYKAPWIESVFPSQKWNRPLFRSKQRMFDYGVSKLLKEATGDSILVGYSGSMLATIVRGQRLGYVTVVERASAHIREQQQIMNEAYNRFYPEGTPPISDQFVEREEQEYDKTDYIVVPSTYVSETFKKHGVSSEKIIILPLGVDPDRVPSPELTQKRDADRPPEMIESVGTKPYLLFIGGVSLRKGIPYLIRAWKKADIKSHELVIIGSIDHTVKDVLKDLPSNIHVLGWVDDIDIWYRNAELFVFPSLEDGFARVVMESLNCGTPVIITERTGAKDRVREGKDGIIIPAGDEEALVSAMYRGINGSWNRRQISNRITGSYTWDHYTDEVVSAYTNMMSNHKS